MRKGDGPVVIFRRRIIAPSICRGDGFNGQGSPHNGSGHTIGPVKDASQGQLPDRRGMIAFTFVKSQASGTHHCRNDEVPEAQGTAIFLTLQNSFNH